jgi:hypothetical protein
VNTTCPDDLWSNPSEKPALVSKNVAGFWYVAFHSLFWLNIQLSGSVRRFQTSRTICAK